MSQKFSKLFYITLCAALSGLIFAVDLIIPLGVAGGVPYIFVILLSLYLPGKAYVYFFALLCSMLTLLGLYISPVGSEYWMVVSNRFLALFAIWVTVIISLKRKETEEVLNRVLDELELRVVERTRRLSESEERFRQLAEHIDEIFWITSPDSEEMIYISPAYERVCGRSCDSLYKSPKDWLTNVHPDDKDRIIKAAEEDIPKGTFNVEYRYIKPDGSICWLHDRGFPIHNDKGEIYRVAGIARDITKRKELEGEILKNERLATLGQLTAMVSHELRNPLASLSTSMYIVQKLVDKKDVRLEQAIERINRNISRCDHIIDELLDFTRSRDLDLQSIKIDTWVGDLLDEMDISEEITIVRELNLPDLSIQIDPHQLRRAVINVIENACHAMLDNGDREKVRVGSILKVSTQATDVRIELAITDNGSGIPADVLPKIFEPLYSTKSFGVGLGLSAVKKIMEIHKGDIEIETSQGHGTRMVLWLPVN